MGIHPIYTPNLALNQGWIGVTLTGQGVTILPLLKKKQNDSVKRKKGKKAKDFILAPSLSIRVCCDPNSPSSGQIDKKGGADLRLLSQFW